MTDPFADLIPEARAFLSELSANNTRDWFNTNKARYESQLKKPAQLLQDQIAATLGKSVKGTVTTKLFRPQRDVRFSKDKTPYHAHLHMFWKLPNAINTGFFFGISPEHCKVGGGIMGLDKAQLTTWRDAIGGEEGQEISTLLNTLSTDGFCPDEPELKRVPAPYGQDHPHGLLLRRKSMSVWRDMSETEWPQPVTALNESFAKLMPLHETLSDILA